MSGFRKIVNDPVYGFVTISHPLVLWVIDHPYYQRLRRIQQMAMAQLVYPGAVHTRLHHSMGAYHLISMAIAADMPCAITNPLEQEIIQGIRAGDMLMGHDENCMAWLMMQRAIAKQKEAEGSSDAQPAKRARRRERPKS